jgi:hypothetical protein
MARRTRKKGETAVTNQQILLWFLGMQAAGVLTLGALMLKVAQSMIKRYSDQVGAEIKGLRLSQDNMKEDMDCKFESHADRLARVESEVLHCPSPDDLARLHSRIDEVSGVLYRLEGESKAQIHTLRLIHEHLLNEVKK